MQAWELRLSFTVNRPIAPLNKKQFRLDRLSRIQKQQTGGSIEVATPDEAQQWQDTRRQFEEAGITLNAEQEARLRTASQQFTAELIRAGMTNPRDLLTLLALPSNQVQAEEIIETTSWGTAYQAYADAISNTLTPDQFQRWQSYLDRQAAANPSSAESALENMVNQFLAQTEPVEQTPQEVSRDQAENARRWEQIKQTLRDAGVPLSPEQETRMVQANEQLATSMQQLFENNPGRAWTQILSLFVFPQPIAERIFGSSGLANPIATHFEAVKGILTPEQFRVWEQSFSQQGQ
ncbi:MAG: hypothetical protein HC895_10230 [Leptolyngbyaceae cyanobacterium SM1_3_5]|nr:hypothetical protein [Leptolyngbyaceae cyanobacterium SM1_3_5]